MPLLVNMCVFVSVSQLFILSHLVHSSVKTTLNPAKRAESMVWTQVFDVNTKTRFCLKCEYRFRCVYLWQGEPVICTQSGLCVLFGHVTFLENVDDVCTWCMIIAKLWGVSIAPTAPRGAWFFQREFLHLAFFFWREKQGLQNPRYKGNSFYLQGVQVKRACLNVGMLRKFWGESVRLNHWPNRCMKKKRSVTVSVCLKGSFVAL